MRFSFTPSFARGRFSNRRQERERARPGEAEAPNEAPDRAPGGARATLARLTGASIFSEARLQHQAAERRSYFERHGRRFFRRHHASESQGNEARPASSQVAEPSQPSPGRIPIGSLTPPEVQEPTVAARSCNKSPGSDTGRMPPDESNEEPAPRDMANVVDDGLRNENQESNPIGVTNGACEGRDEATGVGNAASGQCTLPEGTDPSESSNSEIRPEANDGQSSANPCTVVKSTGKGAGQTRLADRSAAGYCYNCLQPLEAIRPGRQVPERKVYLPCGHFMGHECYFKLIEASKHPRCPVPIGEAPCVVLRHQCGHKHFPAIQLPAYPPALAINDGVDPYLPSLCTWCGEVNEGITLQGKLCDLRWKVLEAARLRQTQRRSVTNWAYVRPTLWAASVAPVYRAYIERKVRLKYNRWWKRGKFELAVAFR